MALEKRPHAIDNATGTMEIEDNANDESADQLQESRCGIGNWHPTWLQRYATKNTFVLVLGLLGLATQSVGSYNSATVSTLEKRFKIPSKTSGIIACFWDVGELFSQLAVGYLGSQRHKPRIMAMGTYLMVASCFARFMIHVVYGPGSDALALTEEYGDATNVLNSTVSEGKSSILCGNHSIPDDELCESGEGSLSIPTLLLVLTTLCLGIGTSSHLTLGFTYIDDNTSKNKSPLALAISMCIRLVGPTVGFGFATYTLAIYVDPSATPLIGTDDPRWIGAWWLGWLPGAVLLFTFGSLMLLFPKRLPRISKNRLSETAGRATSSFRDFRETLFRLFRNPLFTLNSFSAVFFAVGYAGYGLFLPKYMETQYRQSASSASFISGAVGLVCTGLGIMASGVVASRWKPSARALAAWSVFVEVLDAVGHFTWAFLTCGDRDLHGGFDAGGAWSLDAPCNAACGCGPHVSYEPVCSPGPPATTFYSPCHAGCPPAGAFSNATGTFYFDCACSPTDVVIQGPCPRDCGINFYLFLGTQCAMRFLEASGLAGNWLIQFRCVSENDKTMSIAVSEFLLAGIAFIPGPILYGFLLDSTCLVWGVTCGGTGNCWLYDDQKLRYLLNFTAAGCLFCGMVLDIGVWYYSKDLKIYDDDSIEDTARNEENDTSIEL